MSTLPTATYEFPTGVRKFNDSGLQLSITRALNELPANKKGAVVAFATQSAAGMAVVAKLKDNWSVIGVLNKPYNGKLEVEAEVRFTW